MLGLRKLFNANAKTTTRKFSYGSMRKYPYVNADNKQITQKLGTDLFKAAMVGTAIAMFMEFAVAKDDVKLVESWYETNIQHKG
jgi:hypothetical protein